MTLFIVWSALIFIGALAIGLWFGLGWGERRGYGAYEDELGRLKTTAEPPEVAHEDYVPPQKRAEMAGLIDWSRMPDYVAGSDAWDARVGQALALTDDEPPPYAFPAWSLLNADPPTLGEEIQAMIANANAVPSVRWLDRLGES